MTRRSEPAVGARRRLVAVAVALALAVLGALAPVTAASAVGGFTGHLIDQLGQPAAGVPILISQRSDGNGNSVVGVSQTVTTLADGTFGASGLAAGGYEAYVQEGTEGSNDQRFSVVQRLFTIVDGQPDPVLGDIVTNRYVLSTGRISNWTEEMGDVRVDLYVLVAGVQWNPINIQPPAIDTSTDGTFEILAPITAVPFTFRFLIESDDSPYVDTYLGGGYVADPALAAHLDGVPGVGFSGVSVAMPPAAVITGRVTGGGAPLEGIAVEADSLVDDSVDSYAYSETNALGEYTLYVAPGEEYEVYTWGDNDYAPMWYDGWDGCGCRFDPVTAQIGDPADDIDFDLVAYDGSPQIIGQALDEGGQQLEDVEVRLYRPVGGVWTLEDVTTTYIDYPVIGANFAFFLDPAGVHRVQFADEDGRILTILDGAAGTINGGGSQLTPLPACYASAGDVQEAVGLAAVLDTATATGACGSIEGTSDGSIPPATGGGTTTPTKPRTGGTGKAPAVVLAPTATATPTPTPTPSASATPSASPTPSVTEPAEPATASGPDLWWLLWVGLGLLVIVVIGGVVFFVRRM